VKQCFQGAIVYVRQCAGGLNHQIEHHLFPSLPRHNLHKVSSEVRALCAKHGLEYEACGMATGTQRVLARLAEVAHHAANS
jgi:fatty acid desaturase